MPSARQVSCVQRTNGQSKWYNPSPKIGVDMENSEHLEEKSVGTNCIPPGACSKQCVGMIFPPWTTTVKGRKRKRPIKLGYVSIYAIVNLVLGIGTW